MNTNKGGFGKKVLAGIVIGLCFGIFAGLGFEGVTVANKFLQKNVASVGELFSDKEKDKDKENGLIIGEPEDDISDDEVASDDLNGDGNIDEDEQRATLNVTGNPESADIRTTVTDVTEVVKEAMPSLVSVSNKYVAKMNYFGQSYSQEAESAGSGIIIGRNDTELLLVTNYHVVEKAEELSVTFVDENTAPAQLKGTRSGRDIAVIAVQLTDVPSETLKNINIARIGDSNSLTVGEPVVAIGNSLGYGQSVTTGVVSALNRSIKATSSNADFSIDEDALFIQTDAAINPGNSGGALLNIRGELIGINSNKIGGSTVEGMGYAIPISDVENIIEDLMNEQTKLKVPEDSKGYLGITGVNVESQYSEIYGMPVGVYISSVTEGTGADKAGLVRGDIIVEIGGTEVKTMAELKAQLEYYAVGTTVEVKIMQGSPTGYQPKMVSVTLGENLNAGSDLNNNQAQNKNSDSQKENAQGNFNNLFPDGLFGIYP